MQHDVARLRFWAGWVDEKIRLQIKRKLAKIL